MADVYTEPIKGSDIPRFLKPGPGRIAVQVVKPNQQHIGENGVKLWIPDIVTSTRAGDAHLGVVVAVCEPYKKIMADFVQDIYPDFERGNLVIFGKYTGTEVTIGRENFIIMFEQDVLASWTGDIPEEEKPDGTEPTDTDLLRAAGADIHYEAPATRRESHLPPLPPGIG